MRYVEAPEQWDGKGRGVFLAGGITGVEDWQAEAVEMFGEQFEERDDVVVLNPRRAQFDVTDPIAAPAQIHWEYRHLQLADLTLFWFPACDRAVTVQPIALYELGYALGQKRQVVVGASLDYPRLIDVLEQVRHAAGVPVYTSLAWTTEAAGEFLVGRRLMGGEVYG